MIGCITGGDEAAYRREVASLVPWCEYNNLTHKGVIDMSKKRRPHGPLYIWELELEMVSSFKYLGIHISEDLIQSLNTTQLVKKAQR